jgi:hypothetical protein
MRTFNVLCITGAKLGNGFEGSKIRENVTQKPKGQGAEPLAFLELPGLLVSL